MVAVDDSKYTKLLVTSMASRTYTIGNSKCGLKTCVK